MDQIDEVKSLMQRLTTEPSPMHEGVSALHCNALEFGFDRGIVTVTEARYHENSRTARTGWAAIHSLPNDHVEWQKRQQKGEERKRLEDRFWACEERYHDAMLRYASREANALRQERRKAAAPPEEPVEPWPDRPRAVEEDPVEADLKAICGDQLPAEFNPYKMQPRSNEIFTGKVSLEVVPGDLPVTKDYWLTKAQASAKMRAKDQDWTVCPRGLSKAPGQHPGMRDGNHRVPDPTLPNGNCGWEARRRRHVDSKLHHIDTPAPVHPCGPGPCFSAHNPPRRFHRLP